MFNSGDRSGWLEGVKEQWSEFVDAVYDRLVAFWRIVEKLSEFVRAKPVLARTLLVLGSLLVSTFIAYLFSPLVRPESQFLLYLPAVMVSGLFAGMQWGGAATFLGAAAAMFLFVFPNRENDPDTSREMVALFLYLMAAALILVLTHVQEQQKDQIRQFAETLERHVDERTADLRRANEELQSFCYSISHDLRTPMRNIVGSSSMIIEDLNDKLDEEARANLLSIGASANRLSQLVDDLLHHARMSHVEMKVDRVNITAVAEGVADELQRKHPEQRVQFTIDRNMTAFCDSDLIRAVLFHLVDNTFKFADPSRVLNVEIGETRRRGMQVYRVIDNGIGFDMQYVDKIFLPFQRLHRDVDYPGTGIGLANVKRLIERHKGQIWVESEPGKGSTFYFTIGRLRPTLVA